jgi:hypothetical protein
VPTIHCSFPLVSELGPPPTSQPTTPKLPRSGPALKNFTLVCTSRLSSPGIQRREPQASLAVVSRFGMPAGYVFSDLKPIRLGKESLSNFTNDLVRAQLFKPNEKFLGHLPLDFSLTLLGRFPGTPLTLHGSNAKASQGEYYTFSIFNEPCPVQRRAISKQLVFLRIFCLSLSLGLVGRLHVFPEEPHLLHCRLSGRQLVK